MQHTVAWLLIGIVWGSLLSCAASGDKKWVYPRRPYALVMFIMLTGGIALEYWQ